MPKARADHQATEGVDIRITIRPKVGHAVSTAPPPSSNRWTPTITARSTPDEATGPRRSYLDRLLERAEMKPTFPIPLKRLGDSLQRYYAREAAQESAGAGPSSPSGTLPRSSTSSTPVTSAVPGFGGAVKPSSGFGGPSPATATGTSVPQTTTASSSPTAPSATPSSGASSIEERIRTYAANLLRQYDADKNGTLEKSEWSQMSMNPTDADRNHDGHITLDELAAWLLAYSQNRAAASGSSSSSASKMWSSPTSSGKRSYRFLSPAERLPKGLPDWFTQKDTNADGQVSMAEFSAAWTDQSADEFAKYDLNNDGVITADECLKAAKQK